MKIFWKVPVFGFFACSMASPIASGQPTISLLSRIILIEAQNDNEEMSSGTAFMLEVDEREYWITAKHIVNGAKRNPVGTVEKQTVTLKLLQPAAGGRNWIISNFTVIDPGKDIDIVVLAPKMPLLRKPMTSIGAASMGVALGSECEFLGFPFFPWRATWDTGETTWMPFIKHCHVSAIESIPHRIWWLDGINNKGFSGGPVVVGSGDNQKIIAVVSGYRNESAEVVQTDPAPKESSEANPKLTVNVNSGFFLAYDIKYVLDAIRSNPIGPSRADLK